jgi:hypothetical protein
MLIILGFQINILTLFDKQSFNFDGYDFCESSRFCNEERMCPPPAKHFQCHEEIPQLFFEQQSYHRSSVH